MDKYKFTYAKNMEAFLKNNKPKKNVKITMTRSIKIGFLFVPLVPILSLVSCGETKNHNETIDLSRQIVQDVLDTKSLSQRDMEIVAYQLTRPLGTDLQLGITPILFQLRCGLVGLIKVELAKGTNRIGAPLYYGTKWMQSEARIAWKNFNDKKWYNDFILEYQKWALPIQEAKNGKTYILTPNRIIYDQYWNPVRLT